MSLEMNITGKNHQTGDASWQRRKKVMKFKVLLIPSILGFMRAAGESWPAAAACQQAVMEAECESVTHSAHTMK